jgi:hypothetical protein
MVVTVNRISELTVGQEHRYSKFARAYLPSLQTVKLPDSPPLSPVRLRFHPRNGTKAIHQVTRLPFILPASKPYFAIPNPYPLFLVNVSARIILHLYRSVRENLVVS